MLIQVGVLRELIVNTVNEQRDLSFLETIGLDVDVKDLVYAIYEAGFQTSVSCQGGPGHQEPYMVVSVWAEDPELDIAQLEAIVARLNKGPAYRVTPDGVYDGVKHWWVEVFPTSDPVALKKLVKEHPPSWLKRKLVRQFDNIKIS